MESNLKDVISNNLLVVERFVLRVCCLIICNSFDQIIVVCAVILLLNVQRILISTSTIFFFLANNVFVVFKQLACLVFCGWMRLVLVMIILVTSLVPILWSWLCSVWYNLRNIYYTTIALSLSNHGRHHSLRKIMRLWNLIWQNCLRIVCLIEISWNVCLVWAVTCSWSSSGRWSL